MRSLIVLAAGVSCLLVGAVSAQARPAHAHSSGYRHAQATLAPAYRRSVRQRTYHVGEVRRVLRPGRVVGAAVGVAAGAAYLAVDPILNSGQPVRTGYLFPASSGGRTWNGVRSGYEYPMYPGFGGYYSSPDAFGNAYSY